MASKLLAGFALGVLAGILLAPDKGSETRRKIAQKGQDLKSKFNDFVDTIHDKFGEAKEEAGEMVDRAKEKAQAYTRETNPSWNG